uniref:Sigma non-opioid intracellular receptor 1 n=1 Tax=Panagrolaimus sp. ES5 TaxID=591445 RepID=A0AC34FDG9_9BILA
MFHRLIPSFAWKLIIPLLIIRALPSLKNFEFSPQKFRDAATKAASASGNGVDIFTSELRKTYPKSIPRTLYWTPFAAGGLQLRAQIVYPGMMEYIAVFGAPLRTSGRSGFHWSNSSCTVLSGEVTRFADHVPTFAKESFKTGQNFRHGEFESYIYEVAPETFVACYGRGVVPVSALWPITGSVSNGDVVGPFKMAYVYAESYYHWIGGYIQNLWGQATKKMKSEL